MRKLSSIIILSVFVFSVFAVPSISLAATSAQKKAVKKWCKEETLQKSANIFTAYQPITILGVQRIKLGKKKYYTCHFTTVRVAESGTVEEYWWSKKSGAAPYRRVRDGVSEDVLKRVKTTGKRVMGKSNGTFPYGPINGSKLVSATFDKDGGVLSTVTVGGVKVSVVVPEDTFTEGGEITLAPYTEMPSGQEHFALSNALGFGVHLDIKSLQRSTPVFLVFDIEGGEAAQKERTSAAAKNVFFNRCDPAMAWFNPIICARKKKLSPEQIVDKNYAVVTPIHKEGYQNRVFLQETIPTGVSGLIVARVDHGDIYIPQKLDKNLTKDLVQSTLGKFTNYGGRLQAAALALEWDIPLTFEHLEDGLLGAMDAAGMYSEFKKAVLVGRKAATYMAAHRPADEDDREDWEYIEGEIGAAAQRAAEYAFDTAKNDNERDYTDASVEGSSIVADLEDAGVSGAADAADDIGNSLGDAIGNPPADASQAASAAESAAAGDVSIPANDLRSLIDGVYSDVSASIADILSAAATAQAMGQDPGDFVEKIRIRLENLLQNLGLTKKQLLGIAVTAQLLGLEGTANVALERAARIGDEPCNAIMEKTLKTYGLNTCD